MFTFKPAANGSSAKIDSKTDHTNTEPPAAEKNLAGNVQSSSVTQQPNGNGQTAPRGQGLAGWLGFGGNNGHTHAAPRPVARKDNHNGYKMDSVIGPGIHFKGTLTGAGSLRIDGTFDGTINIQGPLLITDGAKVTAEVRAGAVSVGGSLKGNIFAGKVEILSTGRVWGDLVTTAFATEEGAFLRGQVRMEDDVPAVQPEAVPALKTETAPLGL